MNTRQRKTAPVPIPHGHTMNGNGNGFAEGSSFANLWEEWFRHASTPQQAEMLDLAGRQGFLFSHQLPALSNGSAKTKAEPSLGYWQALLAGKLVDFKPVSPHTIVPGDPTLPPDDVQAVARVLQSPDISLLQKSPGRDPAPLLHEISHQEALRQHRVLIMAHQGSSLESVSKALLGQNQWFVLRYHAPQETSHPGLSIETQRQSFRERVLGRSRDTQKEAEDKCQQRNREANLWETLRPLTPRFAQCQTQLQALRERRDRIPQEVQQSSQAQAAPPESWTHAFAEIETILQLASADFDREKLREEESCRSLETEAKATQAARDALQPFYDALTEKRWWTLTYWRGQLKGNVLSNFQEHQDHLRKLRLSQDEARQKLTEIEERRQKNQQQCRAEQAALMSAEVNKRLEELERGIAALESEFAEVAGHWEQTCRQFASKDHSPRVAGCHVTLEAAYQAWKAQRQAEEETCQFARLWSKFMEDSVTQFLSKLPQYAQVVIGTFGGICSHADFAHAEHSFDLLLIVNAEEWTEPELLKVTPYARRWALVGNSSAPTRHGLTASSSCFHRLWKQVNANTGQLPYTWRFDTDHWHCDFRTVPDNEKPYLESESLADYPEIKLLILSVPKKRPCLAQVLFPPEMDLRQAKLFIFRELQELALEGGPHLAYWRETDEAFHFHFGPIQPCHESLPLERGIEETIRPGTGLTHHLSFAKSQGWTWSTAADWVHDLLQYRDLGRTFALADR